MTYPRFLGRIKPELMRGWEDEVRARLDALNGRWEVQSLVPPIGRRILVIAPHPDDEVIGVGGFLIAHRDRAEIHILNLFTGEGGGRLPNPAPSDPDEYREALIAERAR